MKNEVKILIITIAIWIILAIVFGFYDLSISQVLYDPSIQWAIFGDEWGQIPSFALIGISFVILVISFFMDKDSAVWKELRKFSLLVILLAIISPLLFVKTLKFLIKRVRFRCLGSGYSAYTPWYASPIDPSLSNCYASFPSGHTAMAFMFLTLIVFFRDSWLKWLVTVGTVGWGLFIATSRVVIGSHYASDVLFSACFSVVVVIILYVIIYGSDSRGLPFCSCIDNEKCWCRVDELV